jgi:HAD superfamily hydrolase (TIGR01509 family)
VSGLVRPAKSHYMPRMSLRPFSAVVFDMDGTLLDTELVFKEIVWDVSRTLGFTMTETIHLGMVGTSHEATRQLLVESYGVSFPYELFNEECGRIMTSRMQQAVPVKAGVPEFLGDLKARGIPMAVATSSRSRAATVNLGLAGLFDLFDSVITRDDVINPKPHPEPYLLAARRLGRKPADCLAIEDSQAGIRSAHAAGMQTVMVPDLIHPTDEVRALCHAVLGSLHEVRSAAFAPVVA